MGRKKVGVVVEVEEKAVSMENRILQGSYSRVG
jgi:hypothetical protein